MTSTMVKDPMERTHGNEPDASTITEQTPEMLIERHKPWAREQLTVLEQYSENWDGYNAAIPSDEVILAAIGLLASLRAFFSVLEPTVNPIHDGGISLEWEMGSESLEIEIESGKAIYLYKNRANQVRRSGCITAEDTEVSEGLLLALKLMFSPSIHCD